MAPVGSHDQKVRPKASHLIQQDIGRFQFRLQRVQLVLCSVGLEKPGGKIGKDFGLPAVTVDAHEVNGFTAGQPKKLDRLQRTSHLASSPIRHKDAVSRGQFSRYDHNRTRTITEKTCASVESGSA